MKTILLVENGSRHTVAFAHLLDSYNVHRIKYANITAEAVESSDIVILSGGHPSVIYHYWFYKKQLELIRSTNKPVIGICLGFELIVRAYGGRLYRLSRKTHGLRIIRVAIDSLYFGVPTLKVWEAHKWSAKALPGESFVTIAESNNGPEIIQHKTKLIFACQFHPEIREPANDGGKVLEAIFSQIELATSLREQPRDTSLTTRATTTF